jgi:hypothetical protein
MLDFIADPPSSSYWLLVLAVLICAVGWCYRRQRPWLYALLVSSLLLVVLMLCDHWLESPREQAVRRMQAIIAAVQQRQPAQCVLHVADQLEYQGEHAAPVILSREQLRQAPFWELLRHFDVRVAAWDFAREDVRRPSDQAIEIGFLAKGEAEGRQIPFYIRALFVRQPDQSWKLARLTSYDPLKREKERRTIPGLTR